MSSLSSLSNLPDLTDPHERLNSNHENPLIRVLLSRLKTFSFNDIFSQIKFKTPNIAQENKPKL